MGAGWRRFTENFKQKTPFVSGGFTPTQNSRNEVMLKETGDLATQLKASLNSIKAMKDANATGISTLSRLLGAPLPHVYEDATISEGLSASVLVGNGMDVETMTRTGRETATRLETEVITPLMQWLALHDTLVAKNKELDALRLEVDSRRRTVADLTVREATQRARAQRSREDKHGLKVEEAAKLLEHKTAKLAASHQEYIKFEEELHTRIVRLICDAAYIKVHVSQALASQSSALAAASKCVDATPIPEIQRSGAAAAATPLGSNPHAASGVGVGVEAGAGTPKAAPSPLAGTATASPSGDGTNPFMGGGSPPHGHRAAMSMPAGM